MKFNCYIHKKQTFLLKGSDSSFKMSSLVKPLRVGIIWTYAKSLDNKRVYYSVVKYFITNKKVFLSVC